MADHDVAIVGYGPTGAVLAALLGAGGLSVLVVDKAQAIYDKPRALTGDHEVMRVLQAVGAAHRLAATVRPHSRVRYLGADDQPIMTVEVGPPPWPLGWPPAFHFVQPELEALLREAVARHDKVEVRLGTELTGFAKDEAGVTLELSTSEPVRARWLLACDGAASPVRAALAIGHEDLAFDEWWVVVDAFVRDLTVVPEHTTQYCRPRRPGSYILAPGDLRRWEMKVLPGETPGTFADPAVLRRALADFVAPDAVEIWRSAVYRFHALVADRWRQDRIFLLGDAAHQMPPFLGQGLCAGVRDAANLAWKLLMVEAGRADASLLDSYEVERKPHVRQVVALAKQRGLVIGELDRAAAEARDARLRALDAAGDLARLRHKYIPGLEHGVIGRSPDGGAARSSGELFVQPRVRDGQGREGLLDDFLPPAFLVVAASLKALHWIGPEDRARLDRLGARLVVVSPRAVAPPAGVTAFTALDGLLADWLRTAGGEVAIVRPDRYAHAVAAGRAELAAQICILMRQLRRPIASGSAQTSIQ